MREHDQLLRGTMEFPCPTLDIPADDDVVDEITLGIAPASPEPPAEDEDAWRVERIDDGTSEGFAH